MVVFGVDAELDTLGTCLLVVSCPLKSKSRDEEPQRFGSWNVSGRSWYVCNLALWEGFFLCVKRLKICYLEALTTVIFSGPVADLCRPLKGQPVRLKFEAKEGLFWVCIRPQHFFKATKWVSNCSISNVTQTLNSLLKILNCNTQKLF